MQTIRRSAARSLVVALAVAASAAPVASPSSLENSPDAGPVSDPPSATGAELRSWGQFDLPVADDTVPRAVIHDEELVPAGARVSVAQETKEDRMVIRLSVSGLRPGHTYGTHVHTGPCGVDPDDAGPHYQHRSGTNPDLATPENEVWLDFTTDEQGDGHAVSQHQWIFRPGEAGAVVIHEEFTSTGADGRVPGDAGARAGCFTVPFAGYADVHRAGADGPMG